MDRNLHPLTEYVNKRVQEKVDSANYQRSFFSQINPLIFFRELCGKGYDFELMEYFYQNWKQGMSKPAALRRAQIALKNIPQYSHPYYWAPFVMIGDWQ